MRWEITTRIATFYKLEQTNKLILFTYTFFKVNWCFSSFSINNWVGIAVLSVSFIHSLVSFFFLGQHHWFTNIIIIGTPLQWLNLRIDKYMCALSITNKMYTYYNLYWKMHQRLEIFNSYNCNWLEYSIVLNFWASWIEIQLILSVYCGYVSWCILYRGPAQKQHRHRISNAISSNTHFRTKYSIPKL